MSASSNSQTQKVEQKGSLEEYREQGKTRIQIFVRDSIYRELKTSFWKYVFLSFDELPHIGYIERYLFTISLVKQKMRIPRL